MAEQEADETTALGEGGRSMLAPGEAEGGAYTHGSLGRLSPAWWEPEEEGAEPEPWATADEALDRFLAWTAERGIELWPHQEEALMALMVGDHVVLGTPTGSGKSLVALGMCFMAMATGRRSYYTAPIKALVSEKFFDLVDVLGRENVGMITGDAHINAEAPVVCCTAEILANQALREGERADVGCVAMDEFHFYGDYDRGWAWQVPLLTLPKTQFLLMSATLGDVGAIAESLGERTGVQVDVIADAPRPVPLAYEYVEMPLEGTVELALRKGEAPLYLVHFSQDAALSTAQSLASYGVATKEQREAVKEAVKGTRFTTAFGKTLKRLLASGVGVHHAGMLPRYRLLVEKLAQQGLLPVICGTDTLGVGINVPIHTVVLTALTKFDGRKMRRLRAREFHQIVGRAGRSGFDTEGMVAALAPEHDIENAKLIAKAGDDPKKLRKIKKKRAPEGFVSWNRQTFQRLIEAAPETLKPRMKITHSMVLSEVVQGGDAFSRVRRLVEDSAQPPEEKAALAVRADEIFDTLITEGVVERFEGEGGATEYVTTIDVPEDFALDQPLSPFLLAALELLDPQEETYALDVISLAEATLEDPRQVLRAQERQAREKAMAEMKADGVEYEERLERIAEITYPKPLEDLLDAAFVRYCREVPWARDFELAPKSVLRDMLETASDFKTYVGRYKIARSEGTLLRYLSDAYRVLDRTVPADKRDERLDDVVAWLGFVVRSVDSSLMDEWEGAGTAAAPHLAADEVVRDRRGLTVLVRNALFRRVRLAARGEIEELGRLDQDGGFGEQRWREALEAYREAHEDILLDADARSTAYFVIDESDERTERRWRVRQIFSDPEGDHDFAIVADVDLDATQEEGEAVFLRIRAGFAEELAEA
ncbi:DEAD/DEAH box helicase [Enteroscipio rubneri]|uniref:DEAD/DEAH box helicase n=1 Tax=Enteroscipio rubneri TaxID=2070686 RepID=UPI003D18F5A4